jgi:hypothetical protein
MVTLLTFKSKAKPVELFSVFVIFYFFKFFFHSFFDNLCKKYFIVIRRKNVRFEIKKCADFFLTFDFLDV